MLKTFMTGFFEIKVKKNGYFAVLTLFSIIGIVFQLFFYEHNQLNTIRLIMGLLAQLAFVLLLYRQVSLSFILVFFCYIALENAADFTLYMVAKLIYGSNFAAVFKNKYYLPVFEVMHIIINLLYIHIALAIKRRSEQKLNSLDTVFLLAFNTLFLSLIQFVYSAGEQQKYPAEFIILVSLVASLVVLFSVGVYIMFRYQRRQKNAELLAFVLETQKEQIEKLKTQYNSLRKLRHDFKNHFAIISSLISNKDYDEAKVYAESFGKKLSAADNISFCSNPAVDAVLYNKKQLADEHGIELNFDTVCGIPDTIEKFDLCSLLFNILDNALEYCIAHGKNEIDFKISKNKDYLTVACSNECDSFNKATSKPDKMLHGIGLSITAAVAKKYNGNEFVGIKDEKFVHIVNLRC